MGTTDRREIEKRVVQGLLQRLTEYEVFFAAHINEKADHRAHTAYTGIVKTLMSVLGKPGPVPRDPAEAKRAAREIFRNEYGITLPSGWEQEGTEDDDAPTD